MSDCLAKGVKILDGMKCSPLFAPIPLDTWKSEIQLSSGIIIMLFLLSYEVHVNTYTHTHKYIFSENAFFSNGTHLRVASACVADE